MYKIVKFMTPVGTLKTKVGKFTIRKMSDDLTDLDGYDPKVIAYNLTRDNLLDLSLVIDYQIEQK